MVPSYLAEPIHKKWGKSIQAWRMMDIQVRKIYSYNLNRSILGKKVARIMGKEKPSGLPAAGQEDVTVRGGWFY